MSTTAHQNAPATNGAPADTVMDAMRRRIDHVATAASTAIEDRTRTARRAARRVRNGAEDLRDAAALGIRHRPFPAVGIAFAAGAVVGAIAMLTVRRART
jgi:ElaB/YqjD/DUF883 family membrane-anchored ribosome-binding protein